MNDTNACVCLFVCLFVTNQISLISFIFVFSWCLFISQNIIFFAIHTYIFAKCLTSWLECQNWLKCQLKMGKNNFWTPNFLKTWYKMSVSYSHNSYFITSGKIQEVILQEHLEKEDEVLVSLAGLKQVSHVNICLMFAYFLLLLWMLL